MSLTYISLYFTHIVFKEKFNSNTFRMPLNFLSDIHNGKISLKEAEFKQRDLEIKIKDLL